MSDYIGAVGLAVGDLERAARFYTQAFGMKELYRLKLPTMDEIILSFEGRSAALVLMQYKDGTAHDPSTFAGKVVFYFADVAATAQKIRDAGGAITREPAPVPEFNDTIIGFATDLDGYTLELLQRK